MRRTLPSIALACAWLVLGASAGVAQDHDHDEHEDDHHEGLHFSHPLIAESVSPDTKLRLNWGHAAPEGEDELELEGELAFSRSFSIEAGLPYDAGESSFGNAEVTLKGASYWFEDRGLLIGYGASVGLPTAPLPDAIPGEPTPERSWEIAPFVNAGLMRGGLELVAWAITGFETAAEDGVGTAVAWNVSGLYHVAPRLQALIEYDGASAVGATLPVETVHHLTPGVKLLPLADPAFRLGAGLSVPIGSTHDFDTLVVVSAFWHF